MDEMVKQDMIESMLPMQYCNRLTIFVKSLFDLQS